MSIAYLDRATWKMGLAWGGFALVALLLVANLMHDTLFHESPGEAPPSPGEPSSAATAATGTVVLPEGKWKVAGITTAPAELTRVVTEFGVVGRIEANIDRQVEIRPRANGIIREVHALLGQKVKKGDLLVVLDSPDIGTARLNLHNRQRELVTVRTEAAWKNEVAANVARLVPELRALTAEEPQPSPGEAARPGGGARHIDQHDRRAIERRYAELEQKYADRPLGASRGTLLEAYANFEIAHHEALKTSGLYQQNIVGEHPAFLAKHTAEGAQAKFEAALESVAYDVKQQKLVADQQVKAAEASVIDAAKRLQILGAAADIDDLLAHPEKALTVTGGEDLTAYPIVAPFDGTIITKSAVPSQKAEMNDILFTLADLATVWVVANVNEADFGLLQALRPGGAVHLTAAAYPGRTFEARMLSIGAVVEPTTRTVPILAQTDNPSDMFKLGMFVRISLDTPDSREMLTVPGAAVVEIEGQKGVFLPHGAKAQDTAKEKAPEGHAYTFHPVKLGQESGGRQVVLSGLRQGESVVVTGAFFLKSELILQNEPEED